jgi:hypothetical protein
VVFYQPVCLSLCLFVCLPFCFSVFLSVLSLHVSSHDLQPALKNELSRNSSKWGQTGNLLPEKPLHNKDFAKKERTWGRFYETSQQRFCKKKREPGADFMKLQNKDFAKKREPGADFMKLLCGRSVFGQTCTLGFRARCNPKPADKYRYTYLIILDYNIRFYGTKRGMETNFCKLKFDHFHFQVWPKQFHKIDSWYRCTYRKTDCHRDILLSCHAQKLSLFSPSVCSSSFALPKISTSYENNASK